MDRNPQATLEIIIIDVLQTISYNNRTIMLPNGTNITNIDMLTVENRFGTKKYTRIAPGEYGGFGRFGTLIYLACQYSHI